MCNSIYLCTMVYKFILLFFLFIYRNCISSYNNRKKGGVIYNFRENGRERENCELFRTILEGINSEIQFRIVFGILLILIKIKEIIFQNNFFI